MADVPADSPPLDRAAIAADTSSNEAPYAAATGNTLPKAGAKVSASALPSRTVATRTSVARAADICPTPYAFMVEVTASATVSVVPRPAAAALAATSKTSRATTESLIPAEVM